MRFHVLIVDGLERARSTDGDAITDLVLENAEEFEGCDWDIMIEDVEQLEPEELVLELDGSPYPKKLKKSEEVSDEILPN